MQNKSKYPANPTDKRHQFYSLLTILISFLFALSASAEVDNSHIDEYINNLQKAQDKNFLSCKNELENTLQLIKSITNQSKSIKESIHTNFYFKCNLVVIDAVELNFKSHLEEIISSADSESECEQKRQMRACEISRDSLMSILDDYNNDDFKQCLYSSILEPIDFNPIKNDTVNNQNQINVNLLKVALDSLVNIDVNNLENELAYIKRNVVLIDKQLIELIVIQIKNPEKFNSTNEDWCVQNLSIEITTLLDQIKLEEQCGIEERCNKSAMAGIKSALINVQKMISAVNFDKCFSMFNLES